MHLPAHFACDDEAQLAALRRAIVGIESPVNRMVGKVKASQNRSAADRKGVAAGLGGHAMAALVSNPPA